MLDLRPLRETLLPHRGLLHSFLRKRSLSREEDLQFEILRSLYRYQKLSTLEIDNLQEDYRFRDVGSNDAEKSLRQILEAVIKTTPFPYLQQVARYHQEFGADADLENALNRNQLQCKFWILDILAKHLPTPPPRVRVLGGWVGALSAMMIEHLGWKDSVQFETVDIDARTCDKARALLAPYGQQVKVTYEDMLSLRYDHPDTLLINTSCEHIDDFAGWWNILPKGQLVLLQSNDYFSEPTHVNCVENLEAFQRQAPLSETLFAGTMKTKRYNRFMVLGYK